MDDIKVALLLHAILGPIGLLIMGYDYSHSEVWDTWYRNPYIAIPCLLVMEGILWSMLLHGLWKERQDKKTLRMMEESKQLKMQGRHREAEILWQQAVSRIK